jgi:hypothetical protein
MGDNHEVAIPADVLEAATQAVRNWLMSYTLPANYTLDRTYNSGVADANSENLAIAAINAAFDSIAQEAWDQGVIYGHNNEGRLIDKRDNNPYGTKA